jgi:LysR family transcriptional regulator for bpeEF and oprC
MDRLKAMQAFVRIVEANSYTKAAETLDLPRAALTATIKKLEAFLGTQLLQRTTRRLSLTPDGADYFRKCLEILQAVEDAEGAYRGRAAASRAASCGSSCPAPSAATRWCRTSPIFAAPIRRSIWS